MNDIRKKLAEDWLAVDRDHVWHPYSAIGNDAPVYPVREAHGVRLVLEDGRELIDGMASWWAAIHGYNHPVLNAALKEQADSMAHVMFGGLTHRPAVELSALLVDITPEPLQSVFLCDSGSVAMEAAMKMAFQYWNDRGRPGKNRLLSLRGGYHGDTFGAMGVCDPVNGMHHFFSHMLPGHHFAPVPEAGFDDTDVEADVAALEELLVAHHGEIAALVLEPVLQGAGGMRAYSPAYLRRARELCDRYEVLLVADEIATGFGRTGELFACQHAGIAPDIMALGKALTGGYMTLAAVLTTPEVSATISGGDPGLFMHGPTFMGNPLACRVARASIDRLLAGDWQANVRRIEAGLAHGLAPARPLAQVHDVRTLGAVGVIELAEGVDTTGLQQGLVDRGVWVRPFGRLVYVMPPFVMDDADLGRLTAAMVDAVAALPAG